MTVTEKKKSGRNDDEAALVAAVQSGNIACFEALVRRYERTIYRLAQNITKNGSDAEEVTQEAFFKAIEHIEDFKGESRFYTWLTRITVNQALMNVRKPRPNQFSLDDPIGTEELTIPWEIEDWGPTPEAMYSQNELAEILFRAIAGLHPRLRVVFQLRDVEILSAEEAANLLGISIPAVKSRVLRARLALREKLNRFMRNVAQSPTVLLSSVSGTRDMRQARPQRVGMQ